MRRPRRAARQVYVVHPDVSTARSNPETAPTRTPLGSRLLSRTGLLAVVLVLLGGSVAAFAWTEKLKLKPAPVSKAHFVRHFSPTCGCHRSVTRLIFRSRGPERVDVSIVDANGDFVANLAKGKEIPKGR